MTIYSYTADSRDGSRETATGVINAANSTEAEQAVAAMFDYAVNVKVTTTSDIIGALKRQTTLPEQGSNPKNMQ